MYTSSITEPNSNLMMDRSKQEREDFYQSQGWSKKSTSHLEEASRSLQYALHIQKKYLTGKLHDNSSLYTESAPDIYDPERPEK